MPFNDHLDNIKYFKCWCRLSSPARDGCDEEELDVEPAEDSDLVEDGQDKEELDDDEYIWAVGPVDGKQVQVL